MQPDQQCPSCGRASPPTAASCMCGYQFVAAAHQTSVAKPNQIHPLRRGRRPFVVTAIVLVVVGTGLVWARLVHTAGPPRASTSPTPGSSEPYRSARTQPSVPGIGGAYEVISPVFAATTEDAYKKVLGEEAAGDKEGLATMAYGGYLADLDVGTEVRIIGYSVEFPDNVVHVHVLRGRFLATNIGCTPPTSINSNCSAFVGEHDMCVGGRHGEILAPPPGCTLSDSQTWGLRPQAKFFHPSGVAHALVPVSFANVPSSMEPREPSMGLGIPSPTAKQSQNLARGHSGDPRGRRTQTPTPKAVAHPPRPKRRHSKYRSSNAMPNSAKSARISSADDNVRWCSSWVAM